MNTQIRTPNNVDVLMHYYVTAGGHIEHPRCQAPAVEETHQMLYQEGALDQEGQGVPFITPLGRAWVKAILNVPAPQQRFVDEQGRALDPE